MIFILPCFLVGDLSISGDCLSEKCSQNDILGVSLGEGEQRLKIFLLYIQANQQC